MPKRATDYFLIDILIAIDKIKRNTAIATTFDKFISHETVFDATMRELEIIGEAAKYLLADEKFKHHLPLQWRKIVDFRNIVAHEYFGIDLDIVYEVVTKKVPELEKNIFELLQNFKEDKNLIIAISHAKKELQKMNRPKSLAYLTEIEKLLLK